MNKSQPTVTVLMPVHNCEKYVEEAIQSILTQSFKDFEFLILNDASTDNSLAIIKKYSDPRIRIIDEKNNFGVGNILRIGVNESKGEFIVRMDCDDISKQNRIEELVNYMRKHPEVGVCGSSIELFGKEKRKKILYPKNHALIKTEMLFQSPLAGASVIMRRELLMKNALNYDSDFIIAEDYDLWSRCMTHFKLANIASTLYKVRISSDSLFQSEKNNHPKLYYEIFKRILLILDINITSKDFQYLQPIIRKNFSEVKLTNEIIIKTEEWITKIHEANIRKKEFLEPYFSSKLADIWFWLCYKSRHLDMQIWRKYKNSKISSYKKVSLKLRLRFLAAVLYEKIKKKK